MITQAVHKWRCNRTLLFLFFSIVLPGLPNLTSGTLAAEISLITAKNLEEGIGRFTVLDARPRKEWEKSHIPGALSFSWEEHTAVDAEGVPHRIGPPERMAAALSAMGIRETDEIVVYADADKSWGGEGWVCWALSWLGHRGGIRLLEGGIAAWEKEVYPTGKGKSAKAPSPAPYNFRVRSDLFATAEDIGACAKECQIVDTRSFREWITGRIPGAVHISWKKFRKGGLRTPLTPTETAALLTKHGIDTAKPVIYYCTGGIRSAYSWLVHELSGLKTAANFEGGTAAWDHFTKN